MPVISVTGDMLAAARTQIVTSLNRPTSAARQAHERFGPPQPPLDELEGVTVTPDMVGDMPVNAFGEDDFTKDHRVKCAKWLLEAYDLNRHRPVYPHIWQKPGLYLLAGDMGGGKTLYCANIAIIFMMCGWPVYSTAAFLFGKLFNEEQTFAFPEYGSRGAMVFADEFHAIAGRYTGQTIRGQTLAQSTAGFRKEKVWAFSTSAKEWMLSPDIKSSILGIGYPQERQRPEGTRLPKWAHRQLTWYYPDPWTGREYREQFGDTKPNKVQKWQEFPHPYDLHRAGKHFNSWEGIKLDYGGNIKADQFRARAKGHPARKVLTPYAIGLTVLEMTQDGEFMAQEQLYLKALNEGAKVERDSRLMVELSDIQNLFLEKQQVKLSIQKLKDGLTAVGCHSTQRRVHIAALADSLHRAQEERSYDPHLAYGDNFAPDDDDF